MPTFISRVLLVALALGAGQSFAATPDERAANAAETRQGLLKVVVHYFGPMVGMAREQIPYDAELVEANATKIAQLAPLIPDVFRADTRGFDLETEALDKIWDNQQDFADKAATVAERATALANAAANSDQGAAMKAFGALGASCKACHDNYREQN